MGCGTYGRYGSCAAASASRAGAPPCSETGGVKSLAVALSFDPEADACSVPGRLGHSSCILSPAWHA